MDVRDAVASRYSCRAFLPTPIPLPIVRDILDRAARAPSGGNLQPWRVDALAGPRLEALKSLIRPRHGELPRGEGAEYAAYPSPLNEPYRTRRFAVGAALHHAAGIARTDRPARLAQFARNFELFGAPVGLFVSVDRSLGPPQWADLGAFIQTVMLLARGYGLDTCPQEAWTLWHQTVSAFLELPDTQMLFCAIALGHADATAAVNSWRSERDGVDAFATFAGFDDVPQY
jgi:nitroreductase